MVRLHFFNESCFSVSEYWYYSSSSIKNLFSRFSRQIIQESHTNKGFSSSIYINKNIINIISILSLLLCKFLHDTGEEEDVLEYPDDLGGGPEYEEGTGDKVEHEHSESF